MKTILALIAFAFVQAASAHGVAPIERDDVSISDAKVQLISVSPMCPRVPGRPTCAAFGSIAKIKVTMNGCMDRFGGYFSSYNNGVLYFGALNIFNEGSRRVRCRVMPSQEIFVNVPYEGRLQFFPLNYTGSLLPQH